MLLTADVLIPGDGRLADDAQMRPGHEACAAHVGRHFLREVHELDVECPARVDGGVLMGMLGGERATGQRRRKRHVEEVMVQDAVFAHQACHDPLDLRQRHDPAQGRRRGIGLSERGSGRHQGNR